MTKKEKMERLLAKVPEEQKAAFVAELREVKSKDEFLEAAKKYGICLSEDEKEAFQARSNEVSDEELDAAAGGCCSGGQYSCTSTECSDNHIT